MAADGNGYPPRERYVTWDRWDAEHEDLARRVEALEEAAAKRGERQWALILAVLTGLLLPLVVGAILAVTLSH